MLLNLVVVEVGEIQSVVKGKNKYKTVEITYTKEGKQEVKKLFSFANPVVFNEAIKLQPEDNISVTIEKEGDYWQWKAIEKGGAVKSANNVPQKAMGYERESTEERKARQDFIIRQSSIASAVAMLNTDKAAPKVEEVISVAEKFVEFVYNNQAQEAQAEGMEDLADDIPF